MKRSETDQSATSLTLKEKAEQLQELQQDSIPQKTSEQIKDQGLCINCRFWHMLPLDKELKGYYSRGEYYRAKGTCRRYAPSLPNLYENADAAWARTSDIDWCGDFERREVK